MVLVSLGRCVAGCVAASTFVPAAVVGAVLNGASPGPLERAPSLKAKALPELLLLDVELTSADGVRLHAVVDDGTRRVAGRRPIVFVHGFPEGWWSWEPQLASFAADGHPVLAISLRGYGASDKPGDVEAYAMPRLVADVRAAVQHAADSACGQPPLLVGHDWGAAVCWSYVESEMVSSTAAGGEWQVAGYVALTVAPQELFRRNLSLRQAWASRYVLLFNAPWLPELLLTAWGAWGTALLVNDLCRSQKLSPRLLNLYRTDKLQPGAATAQLNYYRAAVRLGFSASPLSAQSKLALPIRMVRGTGDPYLTSDSYRGYERVLERARLVELDDCSHWVALDRPEETIAAIRSLLDEVREIAAR